MANIDILSKAALLAGLSKAQLESLEACGETRGLAQDEVVFEEGAPGAPAFSLFGPLHFVARPEWPRAG